MLMHFLASDSVDVSKYGLEQESSVVLPLPKIPKGSRQGVSHPCFKMSPYGQLGPRGVVRILVPAL